MLYIGKEREDKMYWTERILETHAANEVLEQILVEIKTSAPYMVHSFLAEIIAYSKNFGNPFYGDTGLIANDRKVPSGTSDIRDDDCDQNSIYHFVNGGVHCFIIEILAHIAKIPPTTESLPVLKKYFEYFFNKRRGCTSCAKRVLALFPEDEKNILLIERLKKRKDSYLKSNRHSVSCMELSLWLANIAPLDMKKKAEIMHIFASNSVHNASYLRQFSYQHSVREYLSQKFN